MIEPSEHRKLLPEPEARALLADRGIPITRSVLADSSAAARAAAERIGYPVALKIVAENLLHKTDVGGVKLGLETPQAVATAYEELLSEVLRRRPGTVITGVLVEEMAERGRELIVGLVRDPQFGPVVMVGMGGVLVELYGDVAFAAAPLTRVEAERLVTALRARPLLDAFRGQQPADVEALLDLLIEIGGPGGLVEQHPEIVELDLNPIFLYPHGAKVVDVKIVVEPGTPTETVAPASDGLGGLAAQERAEALRQLFRPVFLPRSVAVVGVSTDPHQVGSRIVSNLQRFGFPGPIYPIHPSAAEIAGRRAYPTVLDVPGEIDRAYVAVPPGAVAGVIEQCGRKGIPVAQIITAGFGEAGPEGQRREAELVALARRGGVRLIGPNCIGTYCPSGKLTINMDVPSEPGPVAFASQSGGLAHDVSVRGGARGLRFSKVLSGGNCADIDLPDVLEYLAHDDETRVIGLYVEGVRDGARFRRLLSETTRHKPVVVLKGGQSKLGERAVAGHTGRLAGNADVWRGVLAQSGAIPARDLEELVDLLAGLHFLPLPPGRGVALIGNGGGATVTASDAIDQVGLTFGTLEPRTQERLLALGLPPGANLTNPIDVPMGTLRLKEGQVLRLILDALLDDNHIDAAIVHLNLVAVLSVAEVETAAGYLQDMVTAVAEAGQRRKPLILTLRSGGLPLHEELRWREQQRAVAGGVPVYDDIPAATTVLAKLAAYREYLEQVGGAGEDRK